MKKRTLPLWITATSSALAFALGVLFGPGVIWSWNSSRRDDARVQIEITDANVRLREKQLQLLSELAQLYRSISPKDPKAKRGFEYDIKFRALTEIEKHLAKMEQREPIEFRFQPPTISAVKFEVVPPN